jgi:hypothetical protein
MAENTDICFSGGVLLECNAEIRDDRLLERPLDFTSLREMSDAPLKSAARAQARG